MNELTKANGDNRARVIRMARVSMPEHQIALSIAVSLKTLRACYAKQLLEAAIETNLEVLETLALMAKSGKNAAATIFWAKTCCGFHPPARKTTNRQNDRVAKDATTEPVPDRLIFEGPDGQFQEVKLP
jgi:hypothetical protein